VPCDKDGKAGAADEAAAKLDAGALANQKFEMLRAKADAADKARALREEKEIEEKAAREKAAKAKWVAERAERAANLTDQVECDFTPPPPFVYAKKPGMTCGEVGSFLLIPECDDTNCCASMAECEERGKMVRGGKTWADTCHSIYMVFITMYQVLTVVILVLYIRVSTAHSIEALTPPPSPAPMINLYIFTS
jgi:hypothetical protein